MAELVHVKGLRELQRAMQELPRRIQGRILINALAAGGRVIEAEAEARVPTLQPDATGHTDPRRRPGTLRKNIRTRPGRARGAHTAVVIIGLRALTGKMVARFKRKSGKGGGANPNDPWYWRFVEFGTSKMAARPFLRPAFESKKYEALKVIKDRLGERIAAEAESLKRGI